MANKFLSFSLASVFIVILLIAAFFQKKRVRSVTNSIYILIMISVLLCITTELLGFWVVPLYYPDDVLMLTLVNKINLVLSSLWVSAVCFYITIIALDNKSIKNVRIRFYIFFVIFLVSAVFIAFSPLEIKMSAEETGLLYVSGMCSEIILYCGIASALVAFFHVMIRKDTSDKGPVIVMVALLFAGVTMGIVEILNPEVIVLSLLQTIILFVLYATIQNPDLNMIVDLNFAKEQVEKASETKTKFLSSMNHEIKTPLNAIVGLSEDLAASDEVPASLKEDIDDIAASSRILNEIIGNIMDINKIEDGTMSVVDSSYSINSEINKVIQLLLPTIESHNNKVDVNISPDVPKVLVGDRVHINKILTNLISNAVKFTNDGTIRIIVNSINDFENMTSVLKVFVIDSGKGIKEENISKLFTRFEKINNSTSIEGTGLGLAITKQLLELMGGSIDVQSTYGKGSTFSFTLPQKMGCAFNNSEDASLKDIVDLTKLKILVVDDNLLNIKVAKRTFSSLGINITYCLSGNECIGRIAGGEMYDIIFMDVLMPEMPGDIVLKKIKERVTFNTPVVALTASVDISYDRKLKSMGFTDYLSKPFNKEQLRTKINSVMADKRRG